MAKEKELTKEEQKKELGRKYALDTLKGDLWNYALPTFASPEQYGQLSKLVGAEYNEFLQKAPSQSAYEKLYLPELSNKGGAVTSPYLQETSARILRESVASLKVGDVLKYFGIKVPAEFKDEDKDKFVFELDEEMRSTIINSYISYEVQEKMKGVLEYSRKAIKGNLEKILIGDKE